VTSYYDLGAANERLGELRPLLNALRDDRDEVAAVQARLSRIRGEDGTAAHDGQTDLERESVALYAIVKRMEAAVRQIDDWGVSLRDIGTGLIDFPALASGRPIWLCWRLGEGDIDWWHELEAGVAGRKPLIELE
jgi:hypothetical protein